MSVDSSHKGPVMRKSDDHLRFIMGFPTPIRRCFLSDKRPRVMSAWWSPKDISIGQIHNMLHQSTGGFHVPPIDLDSRHVNHIATRLSTMRQYTFYGDNIIRIDVYRGTICPGGGALRPKRVAVRGPRGEFSPQPECPRSEFLPQLQYQIFYKNESKESG